MSLLVSKVLREIVSGSVTNNGRQERNQCVICDPSTPPADGMRFSGSDDTPRIMLGNRAMGLSFESFIDTNKAIVDGYNKGHAAASRLAVDLDLELSWERCLLLLLLLLLLL